MTEENNITNNYAHLPEDLILKILEGVPDTVDKFNRMFDVQEQPIKDAARRLRDEGKIVKLNDSAEATDSFIAVDGGNVIEKMAGADLLLAVAVGVEGLSKIGSSGSWTEGKNQYYQWQAVLPHDEATSRLCQGVMFLMEMSVLSNASQKIRIMDGMHFTPLLKINSMLSAYEDKAGPSYVNALNDFLMETYEKIIPDIPDIVKDCFKNDKIVAIAKYSSSRDILDSPLMMRNKISLDDKTFFSLGLNANEYTTPLPVGQSKQESERIWGQLFIKCNLNLGSGVDIGKLNEEFKEAVNPLRTKDKFGKPKKSELFFTYYKPHEYGPAYRIELKKSAAEDKTRFEQCLASIREQIVFPEIREPFPQHVADLMAKSVSGGLYAIMDAIKLSPNLKVDGGHLNLLLPYRTKG